MRKWFVPSIVPVLLILSTSVFAAAAQDDQPGPPAAGQPDDHRPGMPPGGHGMSILNFAADLNISGEQFEKLKAIEKESSAAEEKLFKEARSLMDDMRKETEKDQPDEKTLDAVIDRISANHKQMLLMRVHNMMKIDAVLTRDQRKQLREKFIRGEKQMMKNGPPVGMPGEGGQF
jgi:Spy/CpxP family protein refolding chaperone